MKETKEKESKLTKERLVEALISFLDYDLEAAEDRSMVLDVLHDQCGLDDEDLEEMGILDWFEEE